jgi:hypothetical protein
MALLPGNDAKRPPSPLTRSMSVRRVDGLPMMTKMGISRSEARQRRERNDRHTVDVRAAVAAKVIDVGHHPGERLRLPPVDQPLRVGRGAHLYVGTVVTTPYRTVRLSREIQAGAASEERTPSRTGVPADRVVSLPSNFGESLPQSEPEVSASSISRRGLRRRGRLSRSRGPSSTYEAETALGRNHAARSVVNSSCSCTRTKNTLPSNGREVTTRPRQRSYSRSPNCQAWNSTPERSTPTAIGVERTPDFERVWVQCSMQQPPRSR